MFVGDIRDGIGGVGPRAGMLKVVTDVEGITADVERIMVAAAAAHEETGVAITTHSHPESRNGLDQQAFLEGRDVDVGRIIIGHSGDTDDLDYLRELMDRGSTVGMDRFGMEHVLADDRRVKTLVSLLELGYGDRMVISQDAAIYSHVTPPSWRAMSAPAWRMDRISKHIVPKLLEMGVTSDEIAQMMVDNPRRLLEKAS
jgi:phosphotriesterase-related protein